MTEKRPNILWICTDQQRFDTLGCYGNRFVRTPNLDGLAAQGVLFENCFCQNPVCTPSRASFLTGRYPRTTRCRQNGQSIPEDEVLVTKLIHDKGYLCGLSGKLHLSPCHTKACSEGPERRIDDGYDVFHWSHHPAPDWPTNEYIAWLREQGVDLEISPCEHSRHVKYGMPARHHQTTWCAEKAIDFIRSNAGTGRPWLFSVNLFDPHHGFDPPREYLERYLEKIDEIPLPNYVEGELDNKPIWQKIDHGGASGGMALLQYKKMSDKDHRVARAAYWAMCDLIDEQVGRILKTLDESGLRDNTIVIFMSDHGEMLGDHGIYLKGPFFYEPAVHVPLIISCPGQIKSGRSTALVELTDIAQTLLDAVGRPYHPGMQGKSLWPILVGETDRDRHRDDVYCEYYNALTTHKDPKAYGTMVRTDIYKLVVAHGLNTGELYDLTNDPDETDNQWDNPQYLKARIELLTRLANRMAWTVDPLPLREAPW